MSESLMNNQAATGPGPWIASGHANQIMALVYSTAGAAGTTVTIETSHDKTNVVTELSVSAPTATPVATTQRVYIAAAPFIRANCTVWAAGNVFATVQLWRNGVPLD
jgi:hypothetical protein